MHVHAHAGKTRNHARTHIHAHTRAHIYTHPCSHAQQHTRPLTFHHPSSQAAPIAQVAKAATPAPQSTWLQQRVQHLRELQANGNAAAGAAAALLEKSEPAYTLLTKTQADIAVTLARPDVRRMMSATVALATLTIILWSWGEGNSASSTSSASAAAAAKNQEGVEGGAGGGGAVGVGVAAAAAAAYWLVPLAVAGNDQERAAELRRQVRHGNSCTCRA